MRTTPFLVSLSLATVALAACAPLPLASAGLPGPASGAATRGGAYAARYCAQCHNLGLAGVSRDRRAPPFHAMSGRYEGAELEQVFRDIGATSHYAMRTLRIGPNEARDLAAYMDSLVQD